MSVNKIIGIVLIIGGIALSLFGINKISDSTKSISALGVEISASDNSSKNEGMLYLGFGVVVLIGGVVVIRKS
ncbi:DUF3185 family protein [Fulvivirga sp. 29W222]|uniref:DUF3185 family protein n=1 Tax=Fulvivirga marina TaxID=2494733 RepID=A0A937KB40_9BACT|nr:DUF3185 family protein [Fulvivirga marina]MBL6445414.1 DUF3185 family protein [Fulvivirga marina]